MDRISKRVEIDGYAAGLTFSYGHFVSGHPRCQHIHGHDGAISLRIEGEPVGPFGFVIDFSEIKDTIRNLVRELDGHTIVPRDQLEIYTGNDIHAAINEPYFIRRLHADEVVPIPVDRTTAEEMSGWILVCLLAGMNPGASYGNYPNISKIEVGWFEGRGTSAWSTWTKEESK